MLNFENNVRRQTGLPIRPADETHNKTVKKVSMVIKILGIIILVHGIISSLFAQSNLSNNHCDNSEGVKINYPHEFISDSLYVSYSESAGGLKLKIINTTNQTVYLFSSYFQESDHSSKYLHRINKKTKLYKIAFFASFTVFIY